MSSPRVFRSLLVPPLGATWIPNSARLANFVLTRRSISMALCIIVALGLAGNWATPATAATPDTYYLAPHGSDSGGCTLRAPCATLFYVTVSQCHPNWSLSAGDTVVIESGTYTTNGDVRACDGTVNDPLGRIISVHGTAANPISFVAQAGALFKYAAPVNRYGAQQSLVDIFRSSHVTVSGLTIVGMRGRADDNRAWYGPGTNSPHGPTIVSTDANGSTQRGNVLENLHVRNNDGTCIGTSYGESNDVIRNNVISNCSAPGDTYFDHGVYVVSSRTLIQGNTIRAQPTGCGVQASANSHDTYVTHVTVKNNIIRATGLCGVFTDAGTSNAVVGNRIKGRNRLLVGLLLRAGNVVRKNIIERTRNAISLGYQRGVIDSVKNNTFYHAGGLSFGGSTPPKMLLENNIFDERGGNCYSWMPTRGSVVDHNDYYGCSVPSRGRHAVTADPRFVRPGVDFRLQPHSPMAGRGAVASPERHAIPLRLWCSSSSWCAIRVEGLTRITGRLEVRLPSFNGNLAT